MLGEWSCELLLLEPAEGTWEVAQSVVLPGAEPGEDQAAALGGALGGRCIVAGIRGSDRIAAVAVDREGLRPVGWTSSGGRTPRHLVVDDGFVHVADQDSGTVATLHVRDDGTLEPHGVPAPVPSPTCLAPVPAAV